MNLLTKFETLTTPDAGGSPVWQGALTRLFQVSRSLVNSMNADIHAGLLPAGFCARSNVATHPELAGLESVIRAIIDHYPLEVEAPFEGVETIAGGVWPGARFCEEAAADALLRLQFRAGTVDLPLHSHDHSDRVIFVAEGSGCFELRPGVRHQDVRSISIETGDVLVFARGATHTFRVPDSELVLLSFHSPFIPLSDDRQFTIASE